MNKLACIIIIILINVSCSEKNDLVLFHNLSEQDGIFLLDNEPFTGKVIGYYLNKQKKIEGQLVNGLKEGLWQTWYDIGFKKDSAYYKAGKLHGLMIGWCDCNERTFEINYKNDIQEGVSIYYRKGYKSSMETYKN